MRRTVAQRLDDAMAFAQEAEEISLGMPPEIFDDVKHYQYALRYCLLAVGEALRFVPAEWQALAPEIPWRGIIAMRHRLAHDYWLTDSRLVLEVGVRQAGPLARDLGRLRAAMGDGP